MTFALKNWWQRYERFWVTRDDKLSRSLLKKEKAFHAHFPEQRHLLNFVKNLMLAIRILRKERPDLIFSTGAGVALPFFLVARLYKIKTIFMETFIFIGQPTLTGKLISRLHLADLFLVQNKKLLMHYPQAKYLGSII
jgi:UDP-N-acetylglucosamine:LPS N-acetylglucosamine transferase